MIKLAKILSLAVIAACLSTALWAAGSKAAGTWDCVAVLPDGDEARWKLSFKEVEGKLTGAASSSSEGDVSLLDVALEGQVLRFKAPVQGAVYEVEVTLDGDRFSGKYSGPEAHGAFRGKRIP